MRHGNRSPAVPQARRAIISVTSGSGGRAPGLCVLRDLPRFAHGAHRPRRRRPCLDRHEHETAARELMLFRILPRRILRYALTISPASLPRRHACILTTISPDTGMDAPAGAGSTDADAGWAVQRMPRRADVNLQGRGPGVPRLPRGPVAPAPARAPDAQGAEAPASSSEPPPGNP